MKVDLPGSVWKQLDDWERSTEESVTLLKVSLLKVLRDLDRNEFADVVDANRLRVAVKPFGVQLGRKDDKSLSPGWNVRVLRENAPPEVYHSIRCFRDGTLCKVDRVSPIDMDAVKAQNELLPLPLNLLIEGAVLARGEGGFEIRRPSSEDQGSSGEVHRTKVELASVGDSYDGKFRCGGDYGTVLRDRSTLEKTYLLLAWAWCGLDLFVAELDMTRPEAPKLTFADYDIYDYPALVAVRRGKSDRGYEVFLDKDEVEETPLYVDREAMGNQEVARTEIEDFYPHSGWQPLLSLEETYDQCFATAKTPDPQLSRS